MLDQVVTKVIGIEAKLPSTTGLADKSQFDNDKQNLGKQVEDVDNEILVYWFTTGLVKKTDSDTKIENKIPSTTALIRKTDYDTKITEIKSKILYVIDVVKKIDFNPKLDNSSGVSLIKQVKYGMKTEKMIAWLLLQD